MLYNTDAANNYQQRHWQFLFWTREYRRQALFAYFDQNIDKLISYIDNLRQAIQFIHECYNTNPEEYKKFVKSYYVQRNTVINNDGNENKFYDVTNLKSDFELSLDTFEVSEFLLEELTRILYSIRTLYIEYFNIVNYDKQINMYSMRIIQLIKGIEDVFPENFKNLSKSIEETCNFIPKNFSSDPFIFLINFHQKFGIFPLDIVIPSNQENNGQWSIAYFDTLIDNNKIQTDLKRILLYGLSRNDYSLALNALLPDNKNVEYRIGENNFEDEHSKKYAYIYLSKACCELYIKSFRQKLKQFLLSKKSTSGRKPKMRKDINRYINTAKTFDSHVQVKYIQDENIKRIHSQLIAIFKIIKSISYQASNAINAGKTFYRDKPLQHNYPYLDDEAEQDKILKYTIPKGKEAIKDYIDIPCHAKMMIGLPRLKQDNEPRTFGMKLTSENSIPLPYNAKTIIDAPSSNEDNEPSMFEKKCILKNLTSLLYEQQNHDDIYNFFNDFNMFKCTPFDIRLVMTQGESDINITAKVLDSEADQYTHQPKQNKQIQQMQYSPQIHKDINESHINITRQAIEKSQIGDNYRAGGIILLKYLSDGFAWGDSLSELSFICSDDVESNIFIKFTDSKFWECYILAVNSIQEKMCLQLQEAKVLNSKNTRIRNKYSTTDTREIIKERLKKVEHKQ